MGKIAFLFSGQGSQHAGMGKSLYESFPAVKELFDSAEKSRPGTLDMMFGGEEAELKKTENAQPCLYLTDVAAAIALSSKGIKPDMLAGFSLGEITALAFGGAYTYSDGFELACTRGRLMGEAAASHPASMAAVMKLDNQTVEDTCAKFKQMYPVNYNCPGQLVVSGSVEEMPAFCEEIKKLGGRTIVLNVSGGFHSPFMAEASTEFNKELDSYNIVLPEMPVYSDYTGELYSGDPKELLIKQICNPVRWEAIIRKMAENGVDTFIETGVGGILQKLVTKILPECKAYCAETTEQIDVIIKEVGIC